MYIHKKVGVVKNLTESIVEKPRGIRNWKGKDLRNVEKKKLRLKKEKETRKFGERRLLSGQVSC
jgi:hypothetical protein